MVGAAARCGVHIGQEHARHVVLASEGVVVVEVAVPADGLAILRVGHSHVTGHDFVVLLGEGYDDVLRVIVTPGGDKHRILVVVRQAVVCSIVNREERVERQSLQELVHIVVDAGVELELTAHSTCTATEVAVGDDVGLRGLCAAGEVLAVKQVQRLAEDGKCLAGIRVDHADGNQRCGVLREVRAHRGCLAPEITLVLVGVVERGAHVGITLDEFVDDEVHITAHAEAVGVVVLGRAEVQQVLEAIITNVRVEVGTCAATLNLQRSFRAVVDLAQVFVGVVVHVGIAIRIHT